MTRKRNGRTANTLQSVTSLIRALRRMEEDGTLEPEQMENVRRAMKKIQHGAHTRDHRKIVSGVDELAAAFLRIMGA